MATMADLKARIVRETHRQDLEDEFASALVEHIALAVDKFAEERFWFNRIRATATTVSGTATMALPSSVRMAERVLCDGELKPIAIEEIPEEQSQGSPVFWAAYGTNIYFDPIPSSALPVVIIGTAQIDAPVDDADDNIWTNQAADLIAAQAKGTLYLSLFRNPSQAQAEFTLASDILRRLKTESGRRMKAPLRTDRALLPVYGASYR